MDIAPAVLEWFTLASWGLNFVAILAARETSRCNSNLLRVNQLYAASNMFSVVYFCIFAQWSYVLLYGAFLYFSCTGIIRHRHARRLAQHMDTASRKALQPQISLV